MAYFARVQGGVVIDMHVLNNDVITDDNGAEQESLGQQFLADLHGADPADFVQTSYNGNPINGQDRGPYAGIGYTWDGTTFAPPAAPE